MSIAQPPRLSDAELRTITEKKVQNEHSILHHKVTSTTGHGFLGLYFHVDITTKEKDCEPQKHRFFLKANVPEDSWRAEIMGPNGLFDKEVNFYTGVSSVFRSFLTADTYPECFLAAPDKIVLADATLQGYQPLKDTVAPQDYQHTKVGLEALARLHAGSIIYEEKTGRKLSRDFPDVSREAYYKAGSLGWDFMRTGGDTMVALAPHLQTDVGRNPEATRLFQEHIKSWLAKLEYYRNEKFQHRRVICHGDCWPANYLYKYDDQGTPTTAMIIDFQVTRLTSPACDVMPFLYLSIPTDVLKEWREDLLDAYYQSLLQELKHSGLDVNTIYPKEQFLQDCIYYQVVGVIYGLLFFPFSRIEPKIIAEAVNSNEKALHFFYRDRRQLCIKWYKESPTLQRFINGTTDEIYYNFINSKRGLTQFTS